MLVPLRWLSEWIDLPESPEELAEQLTAMGLEVDSIARIGPDLSELRVGLVVERSAHPEADRLSVCQVDLGEDEMRTIVCGAPNVEAGIKVVVAVPGNRLGGKKLKKSKIRGVVSLGMICSERELGLSEEHEGILVLDPEAPVGEAANRVLGSDDAVMDLAIMANRGDWASLLGVAREVRAAFGGEIRMPDSKPVEGARSTGDDVRVEISDREGCYRYAGRVLHDVRIASSPDWLVQRLEAAGLRSVNNVVDATNLVMLELGQPLHAFDLATLAGGVVRVRAAKAGETITTLDGVERSLEPEDLLIADGERAIAIAGVMGGADSEVSQATTSLLLESAHFAPARVRRTAKRLGLSSDASYRFERGVDRAGVDRALDRAARLIAEIAGGQVSAGVAVATGCAAPAVAPIALEINRVNRVLGTALDAGEVEALLTRLDLRCETGGEGLLLCTIPSHRNDLALPIDLIEEVARIHGYHRIPVTKLSGALAGASKPASLGLADAARDALVGDGFSEVITLPFLAQQDFDRLLLADDDPRRETVRVLNPIAEDQAELRSTLVAHLLHLLRENRNRQIDSLQVFEVCRVFRRGEPGELPVERLLACALIARAEQKQIWDSGSRAPLFFEAKGAALRVLSRLGTDAHVVEGAGQPFLHPGASAAIEFTPRKGRAARNGPPPAIGWIGELHPEVAQRFGIDVPCALIELDIDTLVARPEAPRQYSEVSRHPQMRRDLAVLVSRDQPAGEMIEAIRGRGGASLRAVELFDRYDPSEGDSKGDQQGRVSLAFRLIFQRVDRTLTDTEVSKAVDGIVRVLEQRFNAEQR